jgi:putative addiction module killer protein
MELIRLVEFTQWLEQQTPRSRIQIEDRLSRIRDFGHFGKARDLGGKLAELKWENGRRVYFAMTLDSEGRIVILILGGNKNGQSKDINQARKILARCQE